MKFDLQGQDGRFGPLAQMLQSAGHSIGSGGIVIAPPGERRGLPYYRSEGYALRNAALTAEAAMALLAEMQTKPLSDMSVLLSGCGRIGSRLAALLRAEGAAVTVAVREGKSRLRAESEGLQTVDITKINGPYDAVINTVPAPVLRGNYGAGICLELASAPGGWADGTAVTAAPGLPGKYAPERAAEIMKDAILEACAWKN